MKVALNLNLAEILRILGLDSVVQSDQHQRFSLSLSLLMNQGN